MAIEEQKALLEAAEKKGDVTKAAEVRYGSLKYLEQQLADLEKRGPGTIIVPDTVLPEHIAEAIAERTGVPSSRMLESEKERLLKMEERIGERVFGQDEATLAVADAARRQRADLQPGRKPNSFLFVGPPAWAKRSWPRRWPRRCSTTRTRSSASTWASTRTNPRWPV